jgi:tRNA-2-methylthio-N6-dimethylallyladenosine synthase
MPEDYKVFLHTYGCQMNLYDGELVGSLLQADGFHLTSHPEDADAILINTCAVRDHAEQRVLGRLRALGALKSRHPRLVIGVLGCMAQRLGEELIAQAPTVDLVLGPDAYRKLPGVLREHLSGHNGHIAWCGGDAQETYGDVLPVRREGVSAFVAVMRGCDNFCTYCIVPYARGRERSRPPEEILAEIQTAVNDGFPEIMLLGQNVNSYCWEDLKFPGLLEKIVSEIRHAHPALKDGAEDRPSPLKGAPTQRLLRLRFMTSHPRDLSDELIEVMAGGGPVCPSLHLPAQSGSDRILDLMGRGYTATQYLTKVDQLRSKVEHLALTTDLMCGFPTETEDDFHKTLDLMRAARFDDAFTFKYSPRPGTKAARMKDDVPDAVKIERLERMIVLARQLADQSRTRMIGRDVEVLLENVSPRDESEWTGRTRCGRIALVPGSYHRGDIKNIVVKEVRGFSLWGRLTES